MYEKQDSLEEALSYYEKALEAAETINSNHARATILLHMSSVYQDKNLYEKALALNKQQIEIAKAEGNKILEAQGLENLAGLLSGRGNMEQSSQYYREAKSLYREIGSSESFFIVGNKLARNFLKQERYTEAVETSREVLKQAKTEGILEEMQSSLKILIEAYVEQKDFQNAFKTQRELIAVKDSLFNIEQEKQIAKMQTRYKTEQKEQEIALLRAKMRLSRD